MPYKSVSFVKIRMDLLEEDRFLFDLTDKQKGLYLMLIALAGKTNNKIRDEKEFIKTRLSLKDLNMKDLEEISKLFPKFKRIKGYWKFENFEKVHNYIFKNSKGTPKELPSAAQNKKENKNKKKNENIPDEIWIQNLKKDPQYAHVKIDNELQRMDIWLKKHPTAHLSRQFIIDWVSKIPRPIAKINGRSQSVKCVICDNFFEQSIYWAHHKLCKEDFENKNLPRSVDIKSLLSVVSSQIGTPTKGEVIEN